MKYPLDWLGRAAAAVMLIALGFGAPAASASPWQLAQATPAPAASGQIPPVAHARKATARRPRTLAALTDARIAELHKKLQITTAQEPQFTAMADIMRANARSMDAVLGEQTADTDRTAVNVLRRYEQVTEDHAAALQKFVPAFTALYAVLSDSQRKTADTMFRRIGQRPPPRPHKTK